MNKEQISRMVALEERNKALAEEVQALEFEVKDKDKRIVEVEGELELCEKTHAHVHDENQLNIRRVKMLEAELQQYREPVAEFEDACYTTLWNPFLLRITNGGIKLTIDVDQEYPMCTEDMYSIKKGKTYRVLILDAKDA